MKPERKVIRQALLWIPPACERPGLMPGAPAVPFEGDKPDQVWTLYLHTDPQVPPTLPYVPVHRRNAFAEDYIHDWNVRRGKFHYASRAMDGGVWLLLEYKEKRT